MYLSGVIIMAECCCYTTTMIAPAAPATAPPDGSEASPFETHDQVVRCWDAAVVAVAASDGRRRRWGPPSKPTNYTVYVSRARARRYLSARNPGRHNARRWSLWRSRRRCGPRPPSPPSPPPDDAEAHAKWLGDRRAAVGFVIRGRAHPLVIEYRDDEDEVSVGRAICQAFWRRSRPADVRKKTADAGVDETCMICLEAVSRRRGRVLTCGHVFHGECVARLRRTVAASTPWASATCPLCRAALALKRK